MKKYFQITLRLWKLLKPFHKHLIFQVSGVFLLQAVGVATSVYISKLFNSLVSKELNEIITIFIILFIMDLLQVFIKYIVDSNEIKYLFWNIQQHLKEFSLRKILHLNISQLLEDNSMYKMSVTNKGEASVESIMKSIILNILPVISYTIFSIGTLFYYLPLVGFISTVTLIILFILSIKWATYHRPFIKKSSDNWDEESKKRGEAFQHFNLIKTQGQENSFIKNYVSGRYDNVKYSIFVWLMNVKQYTAKNIFTNIIENLCTAITIYYYSLGGIGIGTIYLVFNLTSKAYSQITTIVQQLRQLPISFIEVEKYLNMIDQESTFSETGIKDIKFGDIVFDDVAFKYPKGEKNVLENFNLVVKENSRTAIVGHSGSGKSTLTKLLLRAYDYGSGSIKIGNTELRDIDATYLRHNLGYVEQHVDLLDDTVKNNITLGISHKLHSHPNKAEILALDESIEHVARLARIDEFYERLGEKKFETVVGERGIKLSGGERQRIGIARAIIKDPKILILDEATSSLDTINEKYIKEAIDNSSRGRTTIIIAHRLSTVQNADMIVVMDNGKIVATGTHKELLAESKHYQDLIAHQLAE